MSKFGILLEQNRYQTRQNINLKSINQVLTCEWCLINKNKDDFIQSNKKISLLCLSCYYSVIKRVPSSEVKFIFYLHPHPSSKLYAKLERYWKTFKFYTNHKMASNKAFRYPFHIS